VYKQYDEEDLTMSEENPAMVAARNSWRCVQSHDKEGWLALMADDVCMEDPIGLAPTNPTGQGVQGKAAVGEFYDTHMAESTIKITTHESYAAEAHESAHVMTLDTTLSNGVKTKVRGIFTYRTDEDGKITNLRGFWNMGVMEFEQPS
jgi:steroid delta-isomerase